MPPHTVLSSPTREVIIGPDQPFCVIGEKINPTNRKKLSDELKAGDYATVEKDALDQVAAGAMVLDVNAGVPLADEPKILAECIQLVQSVTDVPLAIDSSIIDALEAGLAVYQGKPLVNSVTGEEESLERVLPLVKKYGAAVVAISNDETGISTDPDVRFEVAKKIVERAQDHGIPKEDVVVDPLVMPVGAMNDAGRQVFRLLRRLSEELEVNSTCGASNVGFGIPNRHVITGHFIAMAAAAGMTSAIMGATHPEQMTAVRAANTLKGFDPDCMSWLRANRPATPEGEAGGEAERRGRRGGRRRRE